MNQEEISKLITEVVHAEVTKYNTEVIQPLMRQLEALQTKQKQAIELALRPVNADMLHLAERVKQVYNNLAVGKGSVNRVALSEDLMQPSATELRQFSQARINMASLSEVVEAASAKGSESKAK